MLTRNQRTALVTVRPILPIPLSHPSFRQRCARSVDCRLTGAPACEACQREGLQREGVKPSARSSAFAGIGAENHGPAKSISGNFASRSLTPTSIHMAPVVLSIDKVTAELCMSRGVHNSKGALPLSRREGFPVTASVTAKGTSGYRRGRNCFPDP